jgi:hypothetical protein
MTAVWRQRFDGSLRIVGNSGGQAAMNEEEDPMSGKISALDLGIAELSEATKAYFAKCEEKLGLVPNVLLCLRREEAARLYRHLQRSDVG